MRHSKKSWQRRAREASPESLFERALLGDDSTGGRQSNPKQDRKTLQLCRQVERVLILAFPAECRDELLGDLSIESVEPMGGASQLLVRVIVPNRPGVNVAEVLARLNGRAAKLRAAVASSICRKRAPTLSFVAVPAGEITPEGGGRE